MKGTGLIDIFRKVCFNNTNDINKYIFLLAHIVSVSQTLIDTHILNDSILCKTDLFNYDIA